jgi:hypothetical protein
VGDRETSCTIVGVQKRRRWRQKANFCPDTTSGGSRPSPISGVLIQARFEPADWRGPCVGAAMSA